jgi:hypothetical protein
VLPVLDPNFGVDLIPGLTCIKIDHSTRIRQLTIDVFSSVD